jgi:hypothetical protein
MKALFILVASLIFLGANAQAAASGGETGLGVMIGSPNGITGRTWFDNEHSIDYAAGWNVANSSRFQVHVDYLWMRPRLIDINGTKFDFYFGGGISFRTHSGVFDHETVFGPRVPVGMSYEFTDPNLEVFAEAAVNIGLIPTGNTYFDANLGARLYF